jgi:rRNA maturation protein Nop10
MLAKKEISNSSLPKPGFDGVCPHCGRPTRFIHVEQFPGDGPFVAYREPLEKQKTPIVQVRKMKCSREDCGQLIITLDSQSWSGFLFPQKDMSKN